MTTGRPAAFDHLVEGTPELTWVADPRFARLSRLAAPGAGATMVVLAAHPDDEVLGAGGLLAAAASAGATIHVIVATAGEASHPHSPTHSPDQLAALRRTEVVAAVAAVAPDATVTILGLPDGGLRACRTELETALGAVLAPATLLVTPWRHDRHPDHEACALAARAVLRRHPGCPHWQYPIWAWHWAEPDALPWPVLHRLDLAASASSAKHTALGFYRSQHEPLSELPGDEAILGADMLQHFARDYEVFVVEPAHAAGDGNYFDEVYAAADDPWGLDNRFYEQRKRDLILSCLPRPGFVRAFEPGSATGALTELLAQRCGEVVAWDVAERAVTLAAERLASHPGVQVRLGAIPAQWPDGHFDLIVLSEVGYYCDDLTALAEAVRGSLTADGVVVACHWLHAAADHPHDAAAVHAAVGAGLHRLVLHREADFLLEVWSVSPQSVAQAAGIVA